MISTIHRINKEIAELEVDHDCKYTDGCPICIKLAEKKAELPRWIRIYKYTTTPRGRYADTR